MRRDLRRYRSAILLILAFTLGLGAQLLQAQVSVSRGGSYTLLRINSGGVIDWNASDLTLTHSANALTLAGGQLIIPAGSETLPSLKMDTSVVMGLYATNAQGLWVALDGAPVNLFSRGGAANYEFVTRSDSALAWASTTTVLGTTDTYLTRESAAVIQQGYDAATPTAQIYKGPDARAGTDTDTAGGNITFAAGRSTGTGNPGAIFFQTGATNSPGTAAGPLTTRLQIASTGQTIIASHTRFNVASSTTGSGSALLGGNAPIGQVSAPYVWIAVIASDGTAAWIPAWR